MQLFIIDLANRTLRGRHIDFFFLLLWRKPRADVRAKMSAISGHASILPVKPFIQLSTQEHSVTSVPAVTEWKSNDSSRRMQYSM